MTVKKKKDGCEGCFYFQNIKEQNKRENAIFKNAVMETLKGVKI